MSYKAFADILRLFWQTVWIECVPFCGCAANNLWNCPTVSAACLAELILYEHSRWDWTDMAVKIAISTLQLTM